MKEFSKTGCFFPEKCYHTCDSGKPYHLHTQNVSKSTYERLYNYGKDVIPILPLDKLSAGAQVDSDSPSVDPAGLDMCLRLDLDMNGDYGEVWLAFSRKDGNLYRVTVGDSTFESCPLDCLSEPYIDNYATSNRLQVHRHAPDDKPPVQGDMTDEQFRDATRARGLTGTTVILGYCTNTCKLKLLAFTAIWERLANGEDVGADDQIFEQFNRVCPKCGRPYTDQQNKICEHCISKRACFTDCSAISATSARSSSSSRCACWSTRLSPLQPPSSADRSSMTASSTKQATCTRKSTCSCGSACWSPWRSCPWVSALSEPGQRLYVHPRGAQYEE